jgi:hypothetical protein
MIRLLTAILFILPFPAIAGDASRITLGGAVGAAADANMARFHAPPYDSLAWIRADLTGETVTEFDEVKESILRRPFKNYSGDVSGRYLEIMALNGPSTREAYPVFGALLDELPKHQQPGGYFSEWGPIDWQQPYDSQDGQRMMPVLWGNSRMLCGLVEASRTFPDEPALRTAATKLGDFYLGIVPRFTDPARMAEYSEGGTYASGYVTCWFPAMEGLIKLADLTGERKYLDAAIAIAAFYPPFDRLPIDHSHGMLCNYVSLLMLFEATGDAAYLDRVERRWDELVREGYINPAGGIAEKCWLNFERDEGCSEADWLRLNLALGRATGKARYWAMAERTLHNHYLQNAAPTGGFGHRTMRTDENGAIGFTGNYVESTWCCSYHGQIGFVNLRNHLLEQDADALTCNFALDFIRKDGTGAVVSELLPAGGAGEVMRQRIRMEGQPSMVVRVRIPHWADAVTAVDAHGAALPLKTQDGFTATIEPVSEVVFIHSGGVYAEDRRCARLPDGPVAGQPFVLGYGPRLYVAEGNGTNVQPDWPATAEALEAQGLKTLSGEFWDRDFDMVFGLR